MKKLLWLGALALCLPFVTGCTDNYAAALKAHNLIATGISNAATTVDSFRKGGNVTAAEEANILNYLQFANSGNEAFEACAVAAHTNGNVVGSYTSCAMIFQNSLDNPTSLALIKVSNVNGAAAVNVLINGLIEGVVEINTAFGGA